MITTETWFCHILYASSPSSQVRCQWLRLSLVHDEEDCDERPLPPHPPLSLPVFIAVFVPRYVSSSLCLSTRVKEVRMEYKSAIHHSRK